MAPNIAKATVGDDDDSYLPGQQVSTVGRDDAGLPTGVVILIIIFVIILIVATTCGILRLCKKEDGHMEGVPSYSVAISNRLFKEN